MEINVPPYHVIPVHAGGAIALAQSDVTIIDSTFIENSAEVGGALFANDDSTVIIINSSFENNHATYNSKPEVSESADGGAIAVQYSKINISGCRFSNNSAVGYGGAMHIWESTAIISNSEFNNSTAGKNGGAIYVLNQISNTTKNITGSDFSNNRAGKKGGAIYWESVDKECLMIINRSWFTTNAAGIVGGAIMITDGKATISLGQFNSNDASQSGGTLHAYGSTALNIVESEVSDSVTKFNAGGALFML